MEGSLPSEPALGTGQARESVRPSNAPLDWSIHYPHLYKTSRLAHTDNPPCTRERVPIALVDLETVLWHRLVMQLLLLQKAFDGDSPHSRGEESQR